MGVGYRNQTTLVYGNPVKCSMMGGAELIVKGVGFAPMPPSNTPQYRVKNLNNILVKGYDISGK